MEKKLMIETMKFILPCILMNLQNTFRNMHLKLRRERALSIQNWKKKYDEKNRNIYYTIFLKQRMEKKFLEKNQNSNMMKEIISFKP